MKKTFFKTILFSFSVALLFSCTKEYQITVTGTVYDYFTNKPAKNIQVSLMHHSSLPSDGYGYSTVTTTTTDNNGNYSFSYKGEAEKVQALDEGGSDGYLPQNRSNAANITETKPNPNVVLYVRQPATFLINIHNTLPVNNNDNIRLWYGYKLPDYSFTGANVDTTFTAPGVANQYNGIQYQVTKNGIPTILFDSVFVPLGSVPTLQVNY